MTLVSSVDLKKSDGSPLKINFQFENGLPVKPLIQAPVKIWFDKDLNKYGLYFTIDDLNKINNFKLSNVSYHNSGKYSKDVWVHLEQCYLIISNLKNEIVDLMQKNGILITFVDKNGNSL